MLYTIALQVSITVPTVKMRKLCLREIFKKRMPKVGTPLAIQWLRLCTPNAGGTGSIPSQGDEDSHMPTCCKAWPKKKKNFPKFIELVSEVGIQNNHLTIKFYG